MSLDVVNREHWLERLVQGVVPRFKALDYTVPPVHISVGFPSRNALSLSKRRIGECWSGLASSSGHSHIFVSPTLVEPVKVAGVVIHELIHAVVGCEAGHKGPFVKAMKAIGLTGKPTATTEGEELVQWLQSVVLPDLGPYPHAALSANALERKKQSTRMLKVVCKQCGYTARTTSKWLDAVGAPLCPCNGEVMDEEEA